MVFAQLSGRDSLRDIAYGLNTHHFRHYHLGIWKVTKSTLADANELRDYRIYEDIARGLILRAYTDTPLLVKIKGSIYALDASTIALDLTAEMKLFNFTPKTSSFSLMTVHVSTGINSLSCSKPTQCFASQREPLAL